MEKEVLVEVKGLSKKFSRNLKRSLWYGLKEIANTMLGIKGNKSHLRKDEFWAIKDINFELRRGECLGLIGHNGAGKSTLLKMLNGLIRPDQGSITIRGKVGALIELGAGFNLLLSGRENIYINGQLIGFSKKEIDEKVDAIIEFAELGEFIDSPIQNYSSGMKVRLGFAIAAQMEPDVLIIDEVLAVGDLGFVLKCFNTIDTLMSKTAVIFVSHGMPQISRVCSSVMLMEKGQAIFHGNDVSKGIDIYYSKFASKRNKLAIYDTGDDASLVDIQVGGISESGKDEVFKLNHLDDLVVDVEIRVREGIFNPNLTLTFYDKEQRAVGVCMSEAGMTEKNITKKEPGFVFYKTRVTLPKVNLSKGLYSISISVMESFRSKPLFRLQSVAVFQVISKHDVWPPIEFHGHWS